MPEPILFQSLTPEERVNFFVQCQEILKNHHPDSPFTFTDRNLTERKSYFKEVFERYNGFAYSDTNICILFNKIVLKDPKNPIESVKLNKFKGPDENYNAFMIDWVVFSDLKLVESFCRAQYQDRIKYILFSRHNDVKVYETSKLLDKLSKLPQGFRF